MPDNRTGPPMGTVGQRRRLMATCAAAVIALMAPLAGCGATGDQAEAAGGKAGGSVPAEPVVLRMLNAVSEWDSADFVREVEKVSNGQLRIDVVDHWHADDPDSDTREQSLFDAVRNGEAPLGLDAVRAWHDQGITSFDALIAPFLIDRPELQTAILHSDVASDMLAGLDGSGLTGIGILPAFMRHPGGITHPFVDVSDYQGASFVTPPDVVGERSLAALGAIPTASMGGLNRASFDGTDDKLSTAGEDKDVKSITTNVTFGPRPMVLYGNTAALAGLSEQNRTFLQQAAQATIDVKTASERALEEEGIGVACRTGAIAFDVASPAQIAALRAKVEPVYQWLREDATTAGFLDRIQRLSDTVPVDQAYQAPIDCTAAVQNQAPTPAAAATPSVTAPQAPTPVDGTYTVTVTVEDVEAAGTPAGQVPAENWGESVFVFDRGRFATTTHNDQACIWAYGRFALNGDTMIWDFEDGGGQAPNNAANRPGEEFGFNWSLYRDVLTLTKKEGMVSPVFGRPWEFQQVSTTPDPSALNQQCRPPAEAFPNTPR